MTNSYGAVAPPDSVLFPSPFSRDTTQAFVLFPNEFMDVTVAPLFSNVVRQLNFVDIIGWNAGTHQFKFGLDYRRLHPTVEQGASWSVFPSSYASLVAGTTDTALIGTRDPLSVRLHNYSVFGQDTWRTTDRLTRPTACGGKSTPRRSRPDPRTRCT